MLSLFKRPFCQSSKYRNALCATCRYPFRNLLPQLTSLRRETVSGRLKMIAEMFKGVTWGAWALVSLYISLVSGLILGLQYDYATPFYSSSAIDLLIPFGAFFRSLHFYSSQFFFLASVVHLIAIYPKTASYQKSEWYKLIAVLPIALLLLFTGYILRGDVTGFSAGMIAESIMQSMPVAGPILNHLLLSISESGLRKVYLHHVFGFDFLFLLLAWNHLRKYRVNMGRHVLFIGMVILFSVFVSAPLDTFHPGIHYISGPWFFLGLQELLRYLPPMVAGIIIPVALLALVFSVQPTRAQVRNRLWALAFTLICYFVLTIVAWNR